MTSLVWLVAMSFPVYGRRSSSILLLPAQCRLMHFLAEDWIWRGNGILVSFARNRAKPRPTFGHFPHLRPFLRRATPESSARLTPASRRVIDGFRVTCSNTLLAPPAPVAILAVRHSSTRRRARPIRADTDFSDRGV